MLFYIAFPSESAMFPEGILDGSSSHLTQSWRFGNLPFILSVQFVAVKWFTGSNVFSGQIQ